MENANLSVIIAKYNLRRERLTRILHTSRLDGKSTIMAFLQTTPLECIPNPHGTSLEISRNFKEAICQTLIYEFWKATRGSSKFPSLPDDTKDQRSSGGDKIRLGIGKPNGIGCHLYNDNNPTIERRKSLTCRICDVYRTSYSLLGLFGIITTITRKLRPISYNDGRIFLYHALKEASQMKRCCQKSVTLFGWPGMNRLFHASVVPCIYTYKNRGPHVFAERKKWIVIRKQAFSALVQPSLPWVQHFIWTPHRDRDWEGSCISLTTFGNPTGMGASKILDKWVEHIWTRLWS